MVCGRYGYSQGLETNCHHWWAPPCTSFTGLNLRMQPPILWMGELMWTNYMDNYVYIYIIYIYIIYIVVADRFVSPSWGFPHLPTLRRWRLFARLWGTPEGFRLWVNKNCHIIGTKDSNTKLINLWRIVIYAYVIIWSYGNIYWLMVSTQWKICSLVGVSIRFWWWKLNK